MTVSKMTTFYKIEKIKENGVYGYKCKHFGFILYYSHQLLGYTYTLPF